MELAVDCYSITKTFPPSEIYGMTSQIRRASASIAANIAEGYGRENTGSYVQFLRIARGSLKEIETHAIICEKVGLMANADSEKILTKAEEIGKMLNSLIKRLQPRS